MPETSDDAPTRTLKMTLSHTEVHVIVAHVEYVRREYAGGDVKWYLHHTAISGFGRSELHGDIRVRLERLYQDQLAQPRRHAGLDVTQERGVAEYAVRRMEEDFRRLEEWRMDLAEMCAGCGWSDLASRLLRLPEAAEAQP